VVGLAVRVNLRTFNVSVLPTKVKIKDCDKAGFEKRLKLKNIKHVIRFILG
jgi:hypothetical protein